MNLVSVLGVGHWVDERFILHMAHMGLHRYLRQSETVTEISVGTRGGRSVSRSVSVFHEEKQRQVVGLRLKEFDLAMKLIQTLMLEVQRIKPPMEQLLPSY